MGWTKPKSHFKVPLNPTLQIGITKPPGHKKYHRDKVK